MAVPDAEVRRLSQDIVGDASDDRVKAERIFNWVAKNIRYVGIGFADGGFVSQPAGAIIRARYGDCKAHATVLKSLLATQGIAADLAMVNLESRFTIPAVATPSFDHAIVYVPKFDLYLDPTASMSSFNALPPGLYGKPVLDVDRGVVSRIPPAQLADLVVRTDTSITFDSEGVRTGVSMLSGYGMGAALTRSYAERLETKDMRLTAEKELQREGFEGTGSYAFTDPRAASDTYAITASFELTKPLEPGKRDIRLFVNSDPRPSPWELMTNNVRGRSFRCLPVDYTESSAIELPEGLNLAEMPIAVAEDRELKGETRYGVVTGHVSFEGHVALEGRTVRATNHVTAAFDAAVCPAEFSADIEAFRQKSRAFRDDRIKLTPEPVAHVMERGSTYQAALTAYRAGNYEAALRAWRPIAEQGDTYAQVYLGSMYKEGRGVVLDYAQAIAWYRKSAEGGNASGQANLAFMYSTGQGVAVDQAEAAGWYRKSAELGDAYAQCTLAEMYDSAKGLAQDFAQARLWYTKAAEQGYSRAAYFLALMYEQGKGVPVDSDRANEWYRKAADKGYVSAELHLGMLYSDGRGVGRDYTQAVHWFRKAAESGNAVGEYDLGYAYETGLGVNADVAEAKQWYARAASQGYGAAQNRLNSLQVQGWAIRIVQHFMKILR
jgi:TPR repeat protein